MSIFLAAALSNGPAMPGSVLYAQQASYGAATIQDSTEIWAGASQTFYTVGQLPKGSTVTVNEMIAGWFVVKPPAGVFSVVSGSGVRLSDDKKTGTVTADKLDVFAFNPKAVAESTRRQTTLNKGATVNVVSVEGAFLKITPPDGVVVFLKPGSVRRIDLLNETAPIQPAPAVTAPAAKTTAAVATAAEKTAASSNEKPAVVYNQDKTASKTSNPSAAQPSATTLPAPVEPNPLPPEPAPIVAKPTAKPAAPAVNRAQAQVSSKGDPTGIPYVPAPVHVSTTTPSTPTLPESSTTASTAIVKESASSPGAPVADALNADSKGESASLPVEETVVTQAMVMGTPQTNPSNDKLRILELKIEEIQQLPLEQQPLEDLLKQYQLLSNTADLSRRDSQLTAIRIQQLTNSMNIAKTLNELAASNKQFSEAEKAAQEKRAAETKAAAEAAAAATAAHQSRTSTISSNPVKYSAIGQLMASTVYDGSNGPRLYRLVDPANSRTVVYVQPGDNYDANKTLGRVVGIIGQTTYNPGLGLRIITVESIDVLQSIPAARP
jgi:hypothetical protein